MIRLCIDLAHMSNHLMKWHAIPCIYSGKLFGANHAGETSMIIVLEI